MASHNELGKDAEEMGVNFLQKIGYEILNRNWRSGPHEIDIIATKDGMLRVIEVKALRRASIRFPEESVTRKKFRYLQRAADEFLFQNPHFHKIQFEILSIIINPGSDPEYFLIEDVFI